MNSDLLTDLRTALPFAEEAFGCLRALKKAEDKEEDLRDEIKKNKKNAVLATVLIPVAIVLLWISINAFSSEDFLMMEDLNIALITTLCFGGLVLLIIGIVYAAYGFPVRLKQIRDLKKAEAQTKRLSEEKDAVFYRADLQRSQAVYYRLYPRGDMNPENLKYVITCLESGRARTYQEALIRLDEYLHRQKMEDLAEETMKAAKRAASSAGSTTVVYRNY